MPTRPIYIRVSNDQYVLEKIKAEGITLSEYINRLIEKDKNENLGQTTNS